MKISLIILTFVFLTSYQTHTHGIVDLGKTFEDLSTELFKQYKLKNTFHPNHKIYTNLVKGYEESENRINYSILRNLSKKKHSN